MCADRADLAQADFGNRIVEADALDPACRRASQTVIDAGLDNA